MLLCCAVIIPLFVPSPAVASTALQIERATHQSVGIQHDEILYIFYFFFFFFFKIHANFHDARRIAYRG
jgi:hypothetical protein